MEALHEMVRTRSDLPALPEVISRLKEKFEDTNSNFSDIARLIETDPVLAGRIITLANSAYYSSGRFSSRELGACIGRLGLNEIQDLVYTVSLLNMFEETYLLDKHKFWRHSIAVAKASKLICRIRGGNTQEQNLAYLCGLMHDVGIIVFATLIPKTYTEFLKHVGGNLLSGKRSQLYNQEQEAFHIDHATLGALYMETWWPVDEMVILSTQNHHYQSRNIRMRPEMGRLVDLADSYCNRLGFSNGIEIYKVMSTREDFTNFGMSKEQIDTFAKNMLDSFKEVEAITSCARSKAQVAYS